MDGLNMNKEIGPSVWYDTHRYQPGAGANSEDQFACDKHMPPRADAVLSHPATQAGALQAEEVDLIARGMTWEETERHMREACAQAGVQWDAEKEPQSIAINVMQRLANAAHKTGFRLGLERAALAATQPNAAAEPERDRSCAHGCNGCENCIDYEDDLPASQPNAAPGDGQAPMFYASPEQAHALQDRPDDNEGGVYLPLRKTAAGKFTMPLYAAPSTATAAREQDEALRHAVLAMTHAQRGNKGGLAEAIDECNAALASREEALAASVEPPSAKQQKLLDLADRIDHEELWRWAGMDHHKMTPEQRDRMNAGVALRRYAQLWAPGRWVVFPPAGPVHFSASTLDKAVAMAKRDEARCNTRTSEAAP